VRKLHRREERYFTRWPGTAAGRVPVPRGLCAGLPDQAKTRHGEHGNALLSRWPIVSHGHEDMSDHRCEQRGLLHVEVQVGKRTVHVIVLHLGPDRRQPLRQIEQLGSFIEREIPRKAPVVVAGDFNDWGAKLRPAMNGFGFKDFLGERALTYPSRLPLTQLDFVYARGLKPTGIEIPRGPHLVAHVGPPAPDRRVQASEMARRIPPLRPGHHLQLLEGSREFFPRWSRPSTRRAPRCCWKPTSSTSPAAPRGRLCAGTRRAARRAGAVVVDGFGTPEVPPAWQAAWTRPACSGWSIRARRVRPAVPGQWRRLHRKLCVVDGEVGFCGGINILDDFHDPNHGPLASPRLDFSIRVAGPLVAEMRDTMVRQWSRIVALHS
jgi:hypothetical protein